MKKNTNLNQSSPHLLGVWIKSGQANLPVIKKKQVGTICSNQGKKNFYDDEY